MGMTEDLLKFLWKHKLYLPESLKFADGSVLEVIHPGEHNYDAGPDFFNTRIKVGNTIWAGNAEIHVRASDWNKHNHHTNEAYQNVILHIVAENDTEVKNSRGEAIPSITLRCNDAIIAQYDYLLQNSLWVPCAKHIKNVDSFVVSLWMEKLGIARLEEKTRDISLHLEQTQNNWEEVLYRMLLRSFGFHQNSQPFEQLAKSISYKILEKHAGSILHTEALLFGQAGFLSELLPYDDYFLKLQKEYRYLSGKYNIKPLQRHIWKFLRMRPGNFPTVRLAQISAVIHHRSKMFAFIREAESLQQLKELFAVKTSVYWENHYMFGKVSRPKEKNIGDESVETVLINSVIPILFIYGKKQGLEHYQNKALDFLGQLAPEKNSIVEKWQGMGVKVSNAFQSQALLYLKNSYCDSHKCLECSIGSKILSTAASSSS
jgi:hypothetical protein